MIADLIRKNRSCRRFHQEHAITLTILEDLVNLARLSASAANLQPLKYILSCNSEMNDRIFSCLAWAAYLKDWPGPKEGERPSAYIIVCGDTRISKNIDCDHGIASQSILLGAREVGLSGCMLGAVNRRKLRNILKLEEYLKILLVIAIGKPKEIVNIETVKPDGDIKYWRDDKSVHHVPKRTLNDIIINSYTKTG